MNPILFATTLSVFFAGVLFWAFRHLPRERWQMLATIPWRKNADGTWECVNVTYYGFFIAWGGAVALAALGLLLASVGASMPSVALVAGTTLTIGVAAARIVARLVEKKRHTFTVAGALFIGYLTLPLAIEASALLLPASPRLHLVAVLAAAIVGYALGEGIGRLSCLSFGCCYGKRIDRLSPVARRWLEPIALRFEGATKKIAYAEGQEGVAVVPIQAISSVVNLGAGLAGLVLFLQGLVAISLVVTAGLALGWRFVSEWFRADYRGGGKVSAYQWMSLLLLAVSWGLAWWMPVPDVVPDVAAGLLALWHPASLLGLQLAWLFLFIRFGWSTVTYATTRYHVHGDRV